MIDLYVKNGKTISGSPVDVLIDQGKIIDIQSHIDGDVIAKKVLNLESKYYLSSGWIDDHVHCYEKLTLYYDKPDLDGVDAGVTTIVDAGSTGADNLADFYELTKKVKTNVYAMCNISKTGIIAQDELGHMDRIQNNLVKNMIDKYPEFVVGIKARMSKSVVAGSGIHPLIRAKKIQKLNNNIPLMVHIGTNPPELSDIMNLLNPGDIITHCYNGKPNGIMNLNLHEIKQFAIESYNRGIIFDVGHGTDSFNFEVARVAKSIGLIPKSISSDLYHRNRENGPVYNLATCLDKMLHLGYTMEEIIPMITINPANNFNLKNKGFLKKGFDGDLTIFSVENREKELTDSNGNKEIANKVVVPHYAIVSGNVYETKGEF
ncbi:amidohydrolase/deacetylase family metallohydrolase [Companilactobacillus allii]|uniref:Dihydroorotase n=1 Tax=Companilactobacillus allii TaxID=1847728 RepID=A0A1P8Q1W0_9LACO|nr:amidohydrolase/deacetylase family metallohydrolase [Companilactobacillus allii]APX71816.1 dihydroorotase [Companilactobacillus allii]USQ68903.1 amidohydrolase/deacetylase family metallohydrolase [Companilactobacillus allii]